MNRQITIKRFFFYIVVFLCCGNLAASEPDNAAMLEKQVSGLWLYTGLTTSDGKELPLQGIFLFTDDVFVQYAAFDGEPLKDQGAMAHAGPWSIVDEFVHLVARQTISTAPTKESPYSSRGLTEHDVAVSRSGKDLTLVFSKGTGTVQNFERVGSGSGEVYKLKDGALALVDGYFILVSGDESSADTGYGTYEKNGDSIMLKVARWTRADSSSASNIFDTELKATFDGKSLELENGRSFAVTP